jgi:hypothetical protein
MRTFTDAAGEQWQINITAGSLVDVTSELGYDLSCGIEMLPSGIAPRVALLAVLLREQINDRKLTEKQFAQRLSGDAYGDAMTCIMKELADFFSRLRPAYAEILRQVVEQEENHADVMMGFAKEACSSHFFSSEESAASTPGRSPLGSFWSWLKERGRTCSATKQEPEASRRP